MLVQLVNLKSSPGDNKNQTNQVKIIADEVILAKIREEVKGSTYENDECREFDFNTISPIPKELEGTQVPLKIID